MYANKMACIHYQSIMNDWMDCLVYVPESIAEKAMEAVKKGVEMFFADDNAGEPYGDCIERELTAEDIPYLIEYGEYDEDTDEPYPSWTHHISEVEDCSGLKILEVF